MNLKIKKQQSVHESRNYYCLRQCHRTPSIYPAHMPRGLNRITALPSRLEREMAIYCLVLSTTVALRFMGLAHINNPNKSQRPINAKRRYSIY